MMSGFALLSLISLIVCLVLGIHVYFKHVRYVFNNKLGKMFVLLCISLSLCWALIEFGYRQSNDYNGAYSWLKLNVSWYFVISFLLHLSLLFTENKELLKRKTTYLIIYGPALIFFIIDINTNLLFTEPVKELWGWTFGIPSYPLIHSISSTWAAFTAIFCLYIFLEYSAKIHNPQRKKQVKFAIIGMCIPILIGLNTEWLFPILNIKFPELLVPALTLGLILIWYGTWYYSPNKNELYNDVIKSDVDKIIKNAI
jgi:hypothetical protein